MRACASVIDRLLIDLLGSDRFDTGCLTSGYKSSDSERADEKNLFKQCVLNGTTATKHNIFDGLLATGIDEFIFIGLRHLDPFFT